jgi:hypothetical protein
LKKYWNPILERKSIAFQKMISEVGNNFAGGWTICTTA